MTFSPGFIAAARVFSASWNLTICWPAISKGLRLFNSVAPQIRPKMSTARRLKQLETLAFLSTKRPSERKQQKALEERKKRRKPTRLGKICQIWKVKRTLATANKMRKRANFASCLLRKA